MLQHFLKSNGNLRKFFLTNGNKLGIHLSNLQTGLKKASASTVVDNKQLQNDANVVIIGGGVVGVSIAYHLTKDRGQTGVVLLEKSELTAGSTWHAAGLTTYFHPSINPKKIHLYSLDLYRKLHEEAEHGIGLHTPGSLRLCTTPDRVSEANYQMSRQGWNKAEQYLIQPKEIEKLCPILNMDKVICGIYTPNDGHIDPYSLTQALAKHARASGAEILQSTCVTGIKQLPNGKWKISTNNGEFTANHLVNAAGFWAKEVGALIGVDHPLVPIHHQYVITAKINELKNLKSEIPVLRDLEGSYYLRQERDGLLIGPYEAMERMRLSDDWVHNGVPKGFGKELFSGDLERIMPNIEMAMDMVPLLKTAEIRTIINGPITYSPESAPLLGRYQGFHNYWVAIGFGYGIVQAGGAGRFIADWIVDGEPPHELIDLDANRFGKWCTREYSLSKARETYGLNNLLMYPREERWTGRPTSRCGPLYQELAQRGAEFGFHNGWEQPHWFAKNAEERGYKPSFYRTNWFPSFLRECDTVLNAVGVFDITPFAKLKVTGPDATKFLDYVTANTVPSKGKTCITHMITPKGRVYAELTVTKLEDQEYLVLTGSGSELHDLRWLEEHAWKKSMNVTVSNITNDYGALAVAGPNSRGLLQSLTDTDLSTKSFPFLACRKIQVAGVSVLAIRISYTGELGWELYCDMKDMVTLYKSLIKNGAKFGVGDFGSFAMNALRLEKGFRMWNAEMNKDTNPFDAGLNMFVRLKKESDFIGKQALKTISAEKPKRKLVFLTLDETPNCDPEGNESIWFENRVVGNTTSGAFGPQIKHSIAFAYLPPELAEDGKVVQVELLGVKCPAKVSTAAPILIQAVRERLANEQAARLR